MKSKFFNVNKKYCDVIECLSNEQLGVIFRALFMYSTHGEIIIETTGPTYQAFMFFKQDIDCNSKNAVPTYVYIIVLSNSEDSFVKIGIASSLESRYADYSRSGYDIKEVYVSKYASRIDAFCVETDLHKMFSQYKYYPKNTFAGNTECFDMSILEKISKEEHILTNKQ